MNCTCTLYDKYMHHRTDSIINFEILIEIKCVSEFSFLDVVNKAKTNVCVCVQYYSLSDAMMYTRNSQCMYS